MESFSQKNTLLKNPQAKVEVNFLREYFFTPRRILFFSSTLRCFNFFCLSTMVYKTDIAPNINLFELSVSELDTTLLRTDRRASGNTRLAQLGLTSFIESFCFNCKFVLVDNLVFQNPPLRQAWKRV
jgi:hypothetical protein